MQFTTATLLTLVTSLTAAAPSPQLEVRQGVEWHAVGEIYSAGGCTPQSLVYGDPIWDAANTCHPLDRNNQIPPIISYKTISTSPGCTVTLYYDSACSVPAGGFNAGLNGCVQGSQPFESAIVHCPE